METFNNVIYSDKPLFILIRIIFIVLVTFVVAKIYSRIASHLNSTKKIYRRFIYSLALIAIYLVGITMALNEIPNFNQGFSAILAGSGIAALTIGLAAQESLGNAINGMVISFSKPFDVGDRIHLLNGNITGFVEDITLRHTVIRTFMNSRVIIPNSTINKDMVENSNYMGVKASGFVDVIIDYKADMDLAKSIIAQVISSHPDFVDTRTAEQVHLPKVQVFVRNLGLHGVELRASMWTKNINTNFSACSDAREAIKKQFDKEGIAFAHAIACVPQQ